MIVKVLFHSYFKALTGCGETSESLDEGAQLGELLKKLRTRFPKLVPMQRSTLVAVGVEYQGPDYMLREGDEVSLFPPVQGG